MHVKDEIYYHIQRKDSHQPFWNIGDVLTVPVGKKNNPFIDGIFNKYLIDMQEMDYTGILKLLNINIIISITFSSL